MVFAYGIIVSQEVKGSAIYNHTDNFSEVAFDTDLSVVISVKFISTFVDWANQSLVPNSGEDPRAKKSLKQF